MGEEVWQGVCDSTRLVVRVACVTFALAGSVAVPVKQELPARPPVKLVEASPDQDVFEFVRKAATLCRGADLVAVSDHVYAQLDDWLRAGQTTKVELALDQLDTAAISSTAMLAALAATYGLESPSRVAFYARAHRTVAAADGERTANELFSNLA